MTQVGDPASHERNHCFALTKTWSMDLLTWMKKTVEWCVNQGRTQATSTQRRLVTGRVSKFRPPVGGFGFSGSFCCSTFGVRDANAGLVGRRSFCECRFDPWRNKNSTERADRNYFHRGNDVREWTGNGARQCGDSHWQHRHLRRLRAVQFHHTRRGAERARDRKSTRLNSSHSQISYAVFCLKK